MWKTTSMWIFFSLLAVFRGLPCSCKCCLLNVFSCFICLSLHVPLGLQYFVSLKWYQNAPKNSFYVFVWFFSFSDIPLYVTWNHLMRDVSLPFLLWFCHIGSQQIPISVFVHVFSFFFSQLVLLQILKAKKATFWVTSMILLSLQELQS